MKHLSILIFSLGTLTLSAQLQTPYVLPPVSGHANLIPPHPSLPPIPNPPNPYDPYGSIDGREGSAFSDANAAAMHFINIIDNQIYTGAWLDSGGIVHDIVPQKVWAEGMRATRMHLGVVRARKVTGHQLTNSLQGGLSGEFIIIRYATEFANKPRSIEIVTLMRHAPLSLWKVISYQID